MRYESIPINQLEIDLDNPRIKQWIEIYGDEITSEMHYTIEDDGLAQNWGGQKSIL